MPSPHSTDRSSPRQRLASFLVFAAVGVLFSPLAAAQQAPAKANYKLAQKYSTEFLRKFVYDSTVTPQWIGDSELFWYRFRTSQGTRYWLIDPVARTKVALFDHELMAARLSEACQTPLDADSLDLGSVKFDDSGDAMSFTAKDWQFVYHRQKAELEKKEKVKKPARSADGQRPGGTERQRGESTKDDEKAKAAARKERRKQLLEEWQKRVAEHHKKVAKEQQGGDGDDEEQQEEEEERNPRRRGGRSRGSSFSPDLGFYAFTKKGNLYLAERDGELPPAEVATADQPKADAKTGAEAATTTNGQQQRDDTKNGDGKEDGKGDGKDDDKDKDKDKKVVEAVVGQAQTNGKAPAKKAEKKELTLPFDEQKGLQLSEDAAEDYTYGGSLEDDEAMPTAVNWAPDSKAFYVSRSDSRGVAELYLVDSLAEPRPALQKYKYPMPGEENIRSAELMVYDRGVGKLIKIQPKWPDESYLDVQWLKNGELRVLRRDRPMRNVEYGIVDPKTGAFEVLFAESVLNANLFPQSIRYLEDRSELIWWSERSGWGHYYLYGLDGKFKNAITQGSFRASRIVDVDEKAGVLWFMGNAREPDESLYHDHLYRVRLDGGGLKLLDAADATHRSVLSKSRRFLVDNSSRVDLGPKSVLRDGEGVVVMELEQADLSRLEEFGWRPPERFTVKAADGVTDLYGNMWKPFDFDPNSNYPLIVHVYPGPQQEGVTHTFSATASQQELAQLGFIVIQVGHRGGTPTRSKAYGTYGYFNMRDYGLEDKKTAIEELAARHDFIDIDRIGIYGHSGGGFMTAAALLKPPYNRFFKVGVSTSGNHDNNIYNNSWAERYHGLKEVAAKKKADGTGDKKVETDGKTDQDNDQGDEQKGVVTVVDTKGTQGKGNDQEKVEGKDKLDVQKTGKEQQDKKADDEEQKTRYDIKIATNAELAENLEGRLLLIHGEMDNNVHPAGTMRLVDALIKANKRFDMLIIPGARHGYGKASDYARHRTWDYFAEHLIGDRHPGADISEKGGYRR